MTTQSPAVTAPSYEQAASFIKQWQDYMPAFEMDESLQVPKDAWESAWEQFTEKLADTNPFFHPLYAGQMLKPPHPAAVQGYLAAMLMNPNNHALEGGPATSAMEKEVLAQYATRFGYKEEFLGHLTTSGTLANLEALWIAREASPGKAIALSSQAHYSHKRTLSLLNVPAFEIQARANGKMDIVSLEDALKTNDIGTVVVTLGTTGLGVLDPLDEVVALKEKYGFRIHVDMAYGGYYHLLKETEPHLSVYGSISKTDSVVIDPHKQGLQPYGCGCVLFNDASIFSFYQHNSPYTYLASTDDDLHLGEISLECSRSGAAAAALWLTMKCFPLEENTGMGAVIQKQRKAALELSKMLEGSPDYQVYVKPDLDIVTYFPKARTTNGINRRTRVIFHTALANVDFPLYLSLLKVSAKDFAALYPEVEVDSDTVLLLRSCTMKPEHLEWAPQIFQILHHHAQIVRDES